MTKQPNYNNADLQNHIGVAAAIIEDGKVLLMDHVKFNFWTIPVGKADEGQTAEDALMMEMGEELGITPIDFRLVAVEDKTYERNGKDVTVSCHIFVISKYDGEVINGEPEKHRSIEWVMLEDVYDKGDISDSTKIFMEYIKTK